MTQQELEYNKRCVEFLGARYIGKKGFLNWEYYEHDFFKRKEWSNQFQDEIEINNISINSMNFHSDWNWIMEVCISLGMEFVTTNKEQLIQQIYDKLRSMETNS